MFCTIKYLLFLLTVHLFFFSWNLFEIWNKNTEQKHIYIYVFKTENEKTVDALPECVCVCHLLLALHCGGIGDKLWGIMFFSGTATGANDGLHSQAIHC